MRFHVSIMELHLLIVDFGVIGSFASAMFDPPGFQTGRGGRRVILHAVITLNARVPVDLTLGYRLSPCYNKCFVPAVRNLI